jgi:integrase/recombinase XerD
MKTKKITKETMEAWRCYLKEQEKSQATIEKYMRDVRRFYEFLPEEKRIRRESILEYKEQLLMSYKISSVNSMLIALNGFLTFSGLEHMKVRICRFQRPLVSDPGRELGFEEYRRLVQEAEHQGKHRLAMVIQTLCATGIRISELSYITWEAVQTGRGAVCLKGKTRVIILPNKLRKELEQYCREADIYSGPVFISKRGKPLDRSNIWMEMKRLCRQAGVEEQKVFPHNLRHLFARTYYQKNHDIVYLADILGHSSVDTTRIYTSISIHDHERVLDEMELIV